jgi:penicillin amidase
LPGIALGHNERIAWGITIVGTDQADIYVEKTALSDPTRYLVGDDWEPMKIVREKIAVKGAKQPVEIELRFTRHGPVIYQDEKKDLAFALKWAGSEPGGAAYLGGLAVSRARNRSEFLKSLESWKIPSLNFAYADMDGDIGWVAAGAMPIRKPGHHGLLPVPGWTSAYDWQGYLAVTDMPQSFNPKRHWLATANHNILPKSYPHQIAYEWAPPHRFLRIQERLDEKKRFTIEDFQSIQHESTSLPGKTLAKLLGQLKPSDAHAKLLIDWDGVLSRDSAAGALYAVWLQEMSVAFYPPTKFDKETANDLKSLNNISVMLAALENSYETWFDKRPQGQAYREVFLLTTFSKAVRRTQQMLGDDPRLWRWGKLHGATFHHPFEKLGPEHAKAFNLGPVERSGDVNTPHNTRHDDKFQQIHGASYRQVFDLADWDKGRATSTPGQSGQLGSPHYGDLLPLWAEEKYFPLAYSRGKVDEVVAHRLTLTPP